MVPVRTRLVVLDLSFDSVKSRHNIISIQQRILFVCVE